MQRFRNLVRVLGFYPKTSTYSRLVDDPPPLFARYSPWWAQWTYALLACDVIMTASATELVWNHWTEPLGDDAAEDAKPELKPIWLRGGLALSHIATGSVVAAALLVARARYLRTMDIVIRPASKAAQAQGLKTERWLYMQSGNEVGRKGIVFPLEKAVLARGRGDDELVLRVIGERGLWHLGLQNCFINGLSSKSVAETSDALREAWGSAKIVGELRKKTQRDIKWKSGIASTVAGHEK
ncbi:hypothetical protein C8J56DRAFT_917859 [Mycena floridula]|nr:hypothetical protein C8J56DRAFT_917859 [Mycena floridula]